MQRLHPSLNILVATHKHIAPLPYPELTVIQVGNGADIADYLRENQLDNIAEKNPHFCELTILYFIWKNIHSPYVGLVHYRRHFMVKRPFWQRKWQKWHTKLHKTSSSTSQRFCMATPAQMMKQLGQHDLLVPQPQQFAKQTLREQYAEKHHLHDLDIVRNIVAQQFPDYLPAFDAMQNGHILYYGNMFLGKKSVLNQYCEWLFSILFAAEQQIDYHDYSDYNKRIFGFLSERLFTAWLIHHQNDVLFTTMPVSMFEFK